MTEDHTQPELDFSKFKAQQREYIQRKFQMQGRIESLQREYDFIKRLNPDEVAYIMERKREAAATRIQRAYKRVMNKREAIKERMRLQAAA